MDLSQGLSLIGSLGFPIVACIWLAVTFKKSIDANTLSNFKLIESNRHIADVLANVCSKLHIDNNLNKEN
jgi:hypothetical protein